MNRLAIIVRDDAYDKILTPLTFAYTQARQGVKVDMLFLLWAVRVLTSKGAASLSVDGQHKRDSDRLRAKLAADGEPTEVEDFLKALVETGNVSLYGCRYAAQTFEVAPADLMAGGGRDRGPRLVPYRKGHAGRSSPVFLTPACRRS